MRVFLRIRTAFVIITDPLSLLFRFSRNATYLEVNNDEDDHDSGQQIGQVGGVLSVEGVLEGIDLVALGEQEVEQSNDGTLEFSSLVGSDGDGGEALPEDVLANVGSDKERDSRAETVSLL